MDLPPLLLPLSPTDRRVNSNRNAWSAWTYSWYLPSSSIPTEHLPHPTSCRLWSDHSDFADQPDYLHGGRFSTRGWIDRVHYRFLPAVHSPYISAGCELPRSSMKEPCNSQPFQSAGSISPTNCCLLPAILLPLHRVHSLFCNYRKNSRPMRPYMIAEICRFHRNKAVLPVAKKHTSSSYRNSDRHPRQKRSEYYSESTLRSWDHK